MQLLDFEENMLTGVKIIDEQHNAFFQYINAFLSCCNATESPLEIQVAFRRTVSCAKEHFNTEERLLRRIGFPEMQSHRAAHKEVQEVLAVVEEKLKNGEYTQETAEFAASALTQWLSNHVEHFDKKLAQATRDYISRTGVDLFASP